MKSNKQIGLKSNLDGNLAGGSGGAFLILIAESLSSNPSTRQILIYAAPFFGIGISVFWKWAKVRIDQAIKERQLRKYISNCKSFIQNSLNDGNISNERKEELKEKYDQLNKLTTTVHFEKIWSINLKKEYFKFKRGN